MRGATVRMLALILLCTSCTTLSPITGNPDDLRRGINTGTLLKAGDSVSIVTADGRTHRFEVTGIADGVIRGRTESVPVDQVVSVEQGRINAVQTVTLVLAVIAGAALGVAVAHEGSSAHGY